VRPSPRSQNCFARNCRSAPSAIARSLKLEERGKPHRTARHWKERNWISAPTNDNRRISKSDGPKSSVAQATSPFCIIKPIRYGRKKYFIACANPRFQILTIRVIRSPSIPDAFKLDLAQGFNTCRIASTKDLFFLQQNRFCRKKNRFGVRKVFFSQNVERFHNKSIFLVRKSLFLRQNLFSYDKSFFVAEC
jgi:hypothetical protein